MKPSQVMGEKVYKFFLNIIYSIFDTIELEANLLQNFSTIIQYFGYIYVIHAQNYIKRTTISKRNFLLLQKLHLQKKYFRYHFRKFYSEEMIKFVPEKLNGFNIKPSYYTLSQ